jgi:hypothetical protein
LRATRPQLFSKTGVRTRSELVRMVFEQHRDQLPRDTLRQLQVSNQSANSDGETECRPAFPIVERG